jgi:hypothetical protein
MDNIWKNAGKKLRTCDAAVKPTPTTSALTTGTITTLHKPTTVTMTPHWCDHENVTLEQIDENSCRLQQDWPKEDRIPFPAEILETLKALKVAVIARDAGRSTVITPVQTVQIVSPESTQPATETSSKKVEKKCRLYEKCAAAKIPTSVGINGILAPIPVTAQLRTEPITITSTVYKLDTATPAPALTDLWRKVA